MTRGVDPKAFWENKILNWEDSRYGTGNPAPSILEQLAGALSTSLRFRIEEAMRLLAPHLPARRVVELGCGSGLLAERIITAGATEYFGIDISEAAIARARERYAGSVHMGSMTFAVRQVSDLEPMGDALLFSLGLFDWLTDQEIQRVFAMGRGGSYFHAIAEKQFSAVQLLHRTYVHLSYGHRTGSYVPRYHTVDEIADIIGRQGLASPKVYRDGRMRFGIFVTDLSVGP